MCFFTCLLVLSELGDLLASLLHLQLCLTDAESQQDVQLLLELLLHSDFQHAFITHRSVAQSTRRLCPPFPLTAHAQQLRDEVQLSTHYRSSCILTCSEHNDTYRRPVLAFVCFLVIQKLREHFVFFSCRHFWNLILECSEKCNILKMLDEHPTKTLH